MAVNPTLEVDVGLPSFSSRSALQPPVQTGFVGPVTPPGFGEGFRLQDLMAFYSGGFLPAGGGQIGGGGLLDRITGLVTNVGIPILQQLAGVGQRPPTQFLSASAVPATTRAAGGALQRVGGGIITAAEQHPVLTAAGGAAATGIAAVTAARTIRGKRAPSVTMHPDGTVRVHHRRRMNVCNIHALRRALRRAHGFERVVRRVMHFTNPHKASHHMIFKKRRRRK